MISSEQLSKLLDFGENVRLLKNKVDIFLAEIQLEDKENFNAMIAGFINLIVVLNGEPGEESYKLGMKKRETLLSYLKGEVSFKPLLLIFNEEEK